MIDLSRITYRVTVMDGDGNQYNITDYIQNLGWEENENELSLRCSFTIRNEETAKGYLSKLIRPGCLVGIFASDSGSLNEEVARGYVEQWNPVEKNGGNSLKCICYDELYRLQKSQDNRYYPSGTGTKSALLGVLDDWGIPQGDYKGPNAVHGKMVYNNRYLSDIILELLDDAAKKGERRCLIRAEKGRVNVVPPGSNETVYVFGTDNTQSVEHLISTESLITRVKVVGQANNAGKRSVEVTLNGQTEYGIRQRIYIRGTDEMPAAAKTAAQEILNREGRLQKGMKVQSPDLPFLRKGDFVYLTGSFGSDYYQVKSIQHNADACSMTMDLECVEKRPADGGGGAGEKTGYQAGDIVTFHGGIHYVSSYPGSRGYPARAGKARITLVNGAGRAHPWHLIHADGISNVYGWVDEGTFD